MLHKSEILNGFHDCVTVPRWKRQSWHIMMIDFEYFFSIVALKIIFLKCLWQWIWRLTMCWNISHGFPTTLFNSLTAFTSRRLGGTGLRIERSWNKMVRNRLERKHVECFSTLERYTFERSGRGAYGAVIISGIISTNYCLWEHCLLALKLQQVLEKADLFLTHFPSERLKSKRLGYVFLQRTIIWTLNKMFATIMIL